MGSVADSADAHERRSNASSGISEAAARGYVSDRARRRASAKAGWRDRRARGYRPAGRKVGHQRDQALGLAVAFRVQQIDRAAFVGRFAELREQQGILVSERGLETRWQLYRTIMRAYRAKGQEYCTTNGQRARALDLAGRGRCTRTVQRAHRDLAAMGLVRAVHVKRGGWRRGRRDCLRIVVTHSFVAPPSAAGGAGLRPANPPASRPKGDRDSDSIAPPDGGRERPPPAAAGNGSDKVNTDRNGAPPSPEVAEVESVRQLELWQDARARLSDRLRARREGPRRRAD